MQIAKSDLLSLIEPVARMADRKSSMTVLGNMLLWTEDGFLKARATDLENDITRTLRSSQFEDGFKVLVPADKLTSIVKALPDGAVNLELDEDQLVIQAGDSEFRLATWPPDDFPDPPSQEAEQFSMSFAATVFVRILESTIYAMAREEARYTLSGLCFDFLDGKPGYAVTTDGHRLVYRELNPIDIHGQPEGQYIVPAKAVRELIAIFKKAHDSSPRLSFSGSTVTVSWEEDKFETDLSIRLIEGQFPDWRAVSNPSVIGTIVLEPKTLVNTLKRITLLIKERYKPVTFSPEGDHLIIQSEASDLGEAKERIIAKIKGEVSSFKVNATYLIDALKPIEEVPTVEIEVSGDRTPMRIKDGAYVALVMPMIQ